jgi:hypothetical protein
MDMKMGDFLIRPFFDDFEPRFSSYLVLLLVLLELKAW